MQNQAPGGILYKRFQKLCKIHGKTHLAESLFYRKCRMELCNCIKKRFWRKYVSVNFAQILRAPTFWNICEWLLRNVSDILVGMLLSITFVFYLFYRFFNYLFLFNYFYQLPLANSSEGYKNSIQEHKYIKSSYQ